VDITASVSAAEDADVTLCSCTGHLSSKLHEVPRARRLYEEIEQPLVPVLIAWSSLGRADRWGTAGTAEQTDSG